MSALLTYIGVTWDVNTKTPIPMPAPSKAWVCGRSLVGIGGVRILPGAWMFATGKRSVLSGTGLCDGMITRPEDSYRM